MTTTISQFANSEFPNNMIHLPQTKICRKRTTRLLSATQQRTHNLYKQQQLLVLERNKQSCCKLLELLPPMKTEPNQPMSRFYSKMGPSLWGKKPYIWTHLENNDITHKTVTLWKSVWVKLVVKKSNFNFWALSFPVICFPLPNKIDVSKFPHLNGLEFADEFDEYMQWQIHRHSHQIWYYWNIVNGETVHGESGPTAVKSKLGWLLSGPIGEKISRNHISSHLVIKGKVDSSYYTNEHDELLNTIKDFWETESIGIKEQLSIGVTEVLIS